MARAKKHWIVEHWKIIAAIVYFVICLFDFMIMPYLTEIRYGVMTIAQIIELSKLSGVNLHWDPITLRGNGIFHMAFISILTGGILIGKVIPPRDK